jgi:hypothetical protein
MVINGWYLSIGKNSSSPAWFRGGIPHIQLMQKRGRSYVNQSISFPPKLLSDSKERAKNLGLSFSAFVQKCLERDLSERPDVIFKESGGTMQMAAEPPQSPQETPKPRKPRK